MAAVSVTYTVKKGDTVWALARRALESETGKKPSNAEIQALVGKVSVPSGNRNLIYPGEKVKIPLREVKPRPDGRRPAPGGTGRPSAAPAKKKTGPKSSDVAMAAAGGAAAGAAVTKAASGRKKTRKAAKAAAVAGASAASSKSSGKKQAAKTSGGQKSGKRNRVKLTPAQIKGANAATAALRNATTLKEIENVGKQIKQSQTLDSATKKRLTEQARNKYRSVNAKPAAKVATTVAKNVVKGASKTKPGKIVAGAVAVGTVAAKKTTAKKTAKKTTAKKTTAKKTTAGQTAAAPSAKARTAPSASARSAPYKDPRSGKFVKRS